ncbi:MAG: HAD-IIIA family hydrolase [Alphaproteobacteria bacterium]|nr:HAD-IIIA family hydrolase [Alphaproteobacteria bacterium]
MLDRDGVLTEERDGYVKHPGELQVIDGAAAAVAQLNVAGIKTALVSNQSVVGRGIISASMLERIHEKLRAELAAAGARLDLLLTCTDAPNSLSERRKPAPGMLREALAHFRVSAHEAVMIGDQVTDLRAAVAAGVRPVLVRTGKGAELLAKGLPQDILTVRVYASLTSAVEALLSDR